jgi:hypothetical protein
VPSDALRNALQSRLEHIHARFGDPFASLQAGAAEWGPALDQQLDLAAIEHEGRGDDAATAPAAGSKLPFKIAFAVLVLLLLGWIVRGWMWGGRMNELRTALEGWPGLVVQGMDSSPFRSVHVRGLVDALAEPPQTLAARDPWKSYRVEFELRGFVSTDPVILERRARAMLEVPDTVRIAAHDGRLSLSGTAPAEWISQVRSRAGFVPGVAAVDLEALVPSGPSEREQQLATLSAVVKRLEAGEVKFVDETEPSAEGRSALATMAGELRTAQELARLTGKQLRVRALGLTDEVGSDPYNEALRGRRARWLAAELARTADGLDLAPLDAAAAAEFATLRRRAAQLRITVEDSAAP